MAYDIKITDTSEGTGALAEPGKVVTIHYRGFLNRGDEFGSSYKNGSPICFMIGRREVIAGLERGVIGMRVGGCRTLVVSPHLAYRDKGVEGSIPPNAVLRFEVELIDVKDVDKPMG